MTQYRAFLPPRASFSGLKVGTDLKLTWNHETRELLVHHKFTTTIVEDVERGRTGVAIGMKDDSRPSIGTVFAPKHPIARAAWEGGFIRSVRLRTLADVHVVIEEARGGGKNIVTVEYPDYIFAFIVKSDGYKKPFHWAATARADAAHIRQMLANF